MEFEIPVVDTEVDTEQPGDSLRNVAGAVLGVGALAGVVGIATYGYNRVKSIAGVDGSTTPVEGV
jgi:hypothetical protein